MTDRLISEKQEALIGRLLTEKAVPDAFRASLGSVSALTMSEASRAIDDLFRFPRKPAEDKYVALNVALAAVPESYYAIPTDEIGFALTTAKGDNEFIFVRVRTYANRRYIRQIHGAPMGFTNTRLSIADSMAILKHVATDPARFSLLFAKHHKVCGKCGANLTDDESRRLMFGPTCRKVWGL